MIEKSRRALVVLKRAKIRRILAPTAKERFLYKLIFHFGMVLFHCVLIADYQMVIFIFNFFFIKTIFNCTG